MNDKEFSIFKGFSVKIDIFLLFITVLFVACLFTHFSGLGYKPYHHDESIHANSSYNIVKGEGYRYDPTYHGPFLYYATAVSMFLFGDSDFTARIAPAFFGIGLFLLSVILGSDRYWWNNNRNYLLPLLLFLSPIMTYFSRFLRMDIFSCFFAVFLLYAGLQYLRTRKLVFLILSGVGLSLLYCTKENAHITAFIFCSYLVLYGFWYLVKGKFEIKGEGWSGSWQHCVDDIIVPYHILIKALLIFATVEVSLFSYVYLKNMTFYEDLKTFQKAIISLIITTLVLAIIVGIYILIERLIIKHQKKAYPVFSLESLNANESLFMFYMVIIIIFTLFFTNFLHHPERLTDGLVKGIEYWMTQHINPRIAGPFSYYFPLLFVYELPLLFILLFNILSKTSWWKQLVTYFLLVGGFILSSKKMIGPEIPFFKEKFNLTTIETALAIALVWILIVGLSKYLSKQQYLTGFFLYWSVLALFFYGIANEKVPWLATHIVLPQLFLASSILTEFFSRRKSGYRRIVVIFLLCIGYAYVFRSNMVLNFQGESNPREIIVYVQSHQDVKSVLKHIDELEFKKGSNHAIEIILEDEANWPFAWYLRNKPVTFLNSINRVDTDVIICRGDSPDTLLKELDENGFKGIRCRLRAWWIVEWKNLFQKPWKENLQKLRDYILYRKIFGNTIGSYDFLYYFKDPLFSKEEETSDEKLKDPGTADQVKAEVRPEHVDPVKITQLKPKKIIGLSMKKSEMLKGPIDIEIGPENKIYVVDSGFHRIQIFDKNGHHIQSIGKRGEDDGEFIDPQGIAVEYDGSFFVADTWNHRIQYFSNTGEFIRSFGQNEDMWGPRDIELGHDDELFVSDTGQTRILVFSKSGRKIGGWGFKGSKQGYFSEPVGLAVTKEGNLVVADCGNRRIQIFQSDGTFVKAFPVDGWEGFYAGPYLTVDNDNRIIATDPDNDRLLVYSMDGQLLAMVGEQGSAAGKFNKPKGITSFENAIYISDSQNNRVQIFDSSLF